MIKIDDKYSDRSIELMNQILPLQTFESFLTKGSKVLDIGCGIGNMVEYFGSSFTMTGVTYNPEEVATAVKMNRNVVFGDAHDLPFGDGSFEGFLMIDVLEHTTSPLTALSEAKRILKDGGRGIIYIPSADWISCKYHIIVPNLKQMLHLLKLAGLKLVNAERTTMDSYIYYVSK